VDRGAVGVAVVGHQTLDADPEAGEVGDCSPQEADRRRGLLVAEDFDIDEAGRVVDCHVDVLPAELVDPAVVTAAGDAAGNAVAGTPDSAQLLDIDVDELAWTLLLVAVGRLERFVPRQLAEPDPSQDPRHRRGRHRERFRDLGPGHPQPT